MGAESSIFPWGAALQGALGLGQVLFSGAGKAQRKLEEFSKGYQLNSGILDFYNKALSKYSSNPYTSGLYNQQTKMINRNVNAGIASLQDRRSGVAGISSLVQGQNDAYQKAAVGAEQQQSQNLSQLGQATQLKAQEEYKPFEMKYNLLSAKASGANKTLGAGIQNLFGGIGGVQDMALANKMYRGGNNEIEEGIVSGASGSGGSGLYKRSNYLNRYGGFRDLYR